MAYDTNTLTLKGAELLAAATAQDRLVLTGCDATTTYLDQTAAIAIENRPTTPFSTTTEVYLIGSNTNHVDARATFFAGQSTGGDANTLMLFGHKESDPSNVYVLYVASSQTPFHLPQTGDVANAYEALFDIIYSPVSGSVTTPTTSLFVTLTEFETMKERTVTTHKEGQPTVGENQTIYGNKSFQGSVTVGGTVFNPASHNTVSVGSYMTRFKDAFFTGQIYGNTVNAANAVFSGTTQLFDTNIRNIDALGSNTQVTFRTNIVPETGAVYPGDPAIGTDLGSATKDFKTLYVREISNGGNWLDIRKTLYCYGNIYPGTTDTSLGSIQHPWTYGNIGGLRIHDNYIASVYLDGQNVMMGAYTRISYDELNSRGRIEAFTKGAELMLFRDSNGYGQFALGLGSNSATTALQLKYDSGSSSYKANLSMPLNVTNGMTVTGGNFLLTSGSVIIQSSVSTHVVLSESSNNLVVSSSVIPDTTESYTIGSQSKLWAGAYTQAVHFDGLASANTDHAYIDTLNGSIRIMPKNQQTVTIGRDYSTYPCGLIVEGTVQIKGTLTSVGAITGNLTGNVTGNVTGNLNGLIPNPSTADSDTVPIGAVVLLNILFTSAQTYNYKYGSTFTTDNSSYTLSVSAFDATGLNSASSTSLASGQTFRTLSGAIFNNATSSHALAIRIS